MFNMSPYVQWSIIVALAVAYAAYTRVNKTEKKESVIVQKGSAILVGGKDSENEATKKKKPKKKPAKKATKPESKPESTPTPTPKAEKEKPAKAAKQQQQPKKAQKAAPVVESESSDDDDEAVEEDAASMARHLAQFRAGGKSPAPPVAAAQSNGSGSEKPKAKGKKGKVAASSWSPGSDADAEEERFGSSTNPSDMLEPETAGPGVIRITPSQQPPRPQKERAVSQQSTEGTHANKNQKKRERQKAVRAEELR